MTFARLDRLLTRLWLGLAACLALAGGMRLGAAVGLHDGARGDATGCAPLVLAEAGPRLGEPAIHRDPTEAGNLGRARP